MKLAKEKSSSCFITLLLTLALFLSACQSSQEKPIVKQVLKTNLMTSPPSLDPRIGTDTISENLIQMLFSGLTYIDRDGQTKLALAEGLKVSDDQKTFTFYLKNTKWADGTSLTAQDFVLTYKEILEPSFPSESAPLFYLIKGAKDAKEGKISVDNVAIRSDGDSILIIELENPTSYFLDVLTHHSFYPVHPKMRGENLDEPLTDLSKFVCSGPFLLKSHVLQKEIVLEKNPYYWDASTLKLDGIHFSIVRDQNTALMMFEQGDLDWIGSPISDLAIDGISHLKESGVLQVMSVAGVKMFMFNTQVFPLNNANIRKALSLAINRKALVDNITGLNDPLALGLIPPVQKRDNWHAFFQDHDVKVARELFAKGLAELGITQDEFPELTISYNTSDLWNRVVQTVQQQWQDALGITIRLEHTDWKVHLDKLAKGNFQIGRYGWDCQFNDAGNILELFKYKTHFNNYSRWENPKYTQLLDESNCTSNKEKRRELLEAAEKLFIEEMAVAPLFHYNCPAIQKPYVKGVYFSPIAMVDFRWTYLEKS